MSRSVTRQLILKDLYLARWLILGALLGGTVSLAMLPLSRVSFYVGCVTFICVLIILNVILVMASVVAERKERVSVFLLSLPVSTTQYVTAKMIANCLCYFVPFFLLLVGSVIVIRVSGIPEGFIPLTVAVMGYAAFYYSLLLVVALLSESTGWHSAIIVFGNVSINFVIAGLLQDPAVSRASSGPVAVWTASIVAALVFEIALSLIVLALGWYFSTRKKSFV
jgi:ABC-2 type transport system permease protein